MQCLELRLASPAFDLFRQLSPTVFVLGPLLSPRPEEIRTATEGPHSFQHALVQGFPDAFEQGLSTAYLSNASIHDPMCDRVGETEFQPELLFGSGSHHSAFGVVLDRILPHSNCEHTLATADVPPP